MFSYLDAVKPLVDEGIYARGVRLYLEGKVLPHTSMVLDYWREYQVIGKHETCVVNLPVVHLALSAQKYDQFSLAIKQSGRCSCEYFAEYGTCKHIVAVCASLQQEWQPSQIQKTQKKDAEVNFLLDSLFTADEEKKSREIISNLYTVLETGMLLETQIVKKLENFADFIFKNFQANLKSKVSAENQKTEKYYILQKINEIITKKVGNYQEEKRLIRIITNPKLTEKGGFAWVEFWLPYVHQFDLLNQEILWFEWWLAVLVGASKNFLSEMNSVFAKIDPQIKEGVLERIQKQFINQKEYWLKFVFVANMSEWVYKHRADLDSSYLLMAMEYFPEYREEWEIYLQQYMATWTDYLPAGEYEEFLKTFTKWKIFGQSDYLRLALDYVLSTHSKKRSLVQGIQKIL